MARYILGIEWDDMYVHACLIRTSMGDFAMERCLVHERDLDENGVAVHAVSAEIKGIVSALGVHVDACVTALREKDIMHRPVTRPFSDRRKIAGTIGPEMEGLLPGTDNDTVVDFVVLGRDASGSTRAEAFAVNSSIITETISGLKDAGVDPRIIDSPSVALACGARNIFDLDTHKNYIQMHVGWDYTSLAFLNGRNLVKVASFPLGLRSFFPDDPMNTDISRAMEDARDKGIENDVILMEWTREVLISISGLGMDSDGYVIIPSGYTDRIHGLFSGLEEIEGISLDHPVKKEWVSVATEDALSGCFLACSLALRDEDNADPVNFRQGELSFTQARERIKKMAITMGKVMAVFFVLWFAGAGLAVYLDGRILDDLSSRLEKEFVSVMPKGTPMVNPVVQMEQRLSTLSGKGISDSNGSALETIRDISKAVSPEIDVTMENITIDENGITLWGNTDSYDNVEKIKESLLSLAYIPEVRIVSANVDKKDKRVSFKMTCKKRKV
ncbi:MAG: GspL/Epsl periplasmic domain-containing protein [Thermodesulfobacteriota bacterium]|nr:GspL/Epsl periplasmic domain-containing protein [Thermodesulfobacteriota bacterium]